MIYDLLERKKEVDKTNRMFADRRSGVIAATFANAWRDTKKQKDPYTWVDFFPDHKPPQKVQSDEEIAFALKLWARRSEVIARARGE